MSGAPEDQQTVNRAFSFFGWIWKRLGRRGPRLLFGIGAVLAISYVHNRNVRVHDSAVLTFRNVTLELSSSVPNPSTELWPAIRAVTFEGLTGAGAVRPGAQPVKLPDGNGAFERTDAGPLDLTFLNLRVRGSRCPQATLEVSSGGVAYRFPAACEPSNGNLSGKLTEGYVFRPPADLPSGRSPLDITWTRASAVRILLAASSDTRANQEVLDLAHTGDSVQVNRITGVLAIPASLTTGCLSRCDPDAGERIVVVAPDLRVLEITYSPDGHGVVLTVDGIDQNSSIKRCSRPSTQQGERDDDASAPSADRCDEDLCRWPWGGLFADFSALLLSLLAVVLA
jgi:hypothetical protein